MRVIAAFHGRHTHFHTPSLLHTPYPFVHSSQSLGVDFESTRKRLLSLFDTEGTLPSFQQPPYEASTFHYPSSSVQSPLTPPLLMSTPPLQTRFAPSQYEDPTGCPVQAYSEKFSSTIPDRIRRLDQPDYWAIAAIPLKLFHLRFGPGDSQRGAGAPAPHLSPSSRARKITRGEALCRSSTTARATTSHSTSSSRDDQYAKYGASVLRRITSATAPGPPSSATSGDQAPHLGRVCLAS